MARLILTALLVLAGLAPAEGQVIRVAGTVKGDDGRPVRGAAVTAENPDHTPPRLSTTSNDKGEFGFIGIRRGVWTMRVEAPGFESQQFRRSVGTGRQPAIDVRLARAAAPVALQLDGVKAGDIQQHINRAESLASSGDLDGAIAAWRDVLATVPALTSIHLQLGALYERKSDPDGARAAYRRLLDLEPANAKAIAAIERLSRQF